MGAINDLRDFRARGYMGKIASHLREGDRIIDIGSGSGAVAKELKNGGYAVTPLDIVDKSVYPEFRPTLYDGKTIPFPDNSFDTAILINVLHHTEEPVKLLQEAARVASRVVVIEDLYKSPLQKYLTYFMDSCLNLEFAGHPHSNMTAGQWEEIFKRLGLRMLGRRILNFWLFFTSGIFYLERAS